MYALGVCILLTDSNIGNAEKIEMPDKVTISV
jgi:hypothetical protein